MASQILGRILVVDDQHNWRQVLRTLLEIEGCEVVEAKSFMEAKELLTKSDSHFDLAVLDVRLVDSETYNVQGLELLHFIKQHLKEMKTIVLTSYTDSAKGAKEEADVFIPKGKGEQLFDNKKFRRRVRELLQSPTDS